MISKLLTEISLKKGNKITVEALSHISESVFKKVQECKKFKDYIEKIDNAEEGVSVSKIEILGVEMFGEKVGFVNLRTVTHKDNFNLPGYVFLRGPAVAILMLVNGKILVVEQYRVPVQKTIIEAPAGMLDESGDFVGQAAAEIEEETSIKITNDKLLPLGSFYPSVGGSDEEILMYVCELSLPEEEVKEIEKKIHGKEGERERIKIKFIEYDLQEVIATKDSKLICLISAYENFKTKNTN